MKRYYNDKELDLSMEANKELTVHETQALYDVFRDYNDSEVSE